MAFEFRGSIENVRISYALTTSHRGKGIATKCANILIEVLIQQGVKTFEADIDRDNLKSEKVVERLGFSTNKKEALMDPEMMREGEMRFRSLWKKDSRLKNYDSEATTWNRIPIDANANQLIAAINQAVSLIKEKGEHPLLVARYFYLLGRIKFLEGNYDEASNAFGNCNMTTYNNNTPDNHETFYWFARIKEQKGESKSNIQMYYTSALEHYNDNPSIITKEEILQAMNKI